MGAAWLGGAVLLVLLAWVLQWVAVDLLSQEAVARLQQADDVLLPPRGNQSKPVPPPVGSADGTSPLAFPLVPPDATRSTPPPQATPPATHGATERSPRGVALSRELVLDLARRRAIPGWTTQPASAGHRAGIELVDGMPGLGVLPGDRVVAVGGQATPDFSSLTQRVIAALLAGESALSVTLERSDSGTTSTIPVLVELPELPDDVRQQL